MKPNRNVFMAVAAVGVPLLLAALPGPSARAVLPALDYPVGRPLTVIYHTSAGFAPALLAPGPLLGFPSSVMPPLPGPGVNCSTGDFNGECSVSGDSERCSAQNDNANRCSVIGANPGTCSALGTNSICSVLPPVSTEMVPSQCSTFAQQFPQECSAVTLGRNARCSAKGAGLSTCSTHPDPLLIGQASCSVLNAGAPQRSFCSVKFNQLAVAKGCSAFASGTQCSVALGGSGVCTTFGAANPGSCSAFDPNALCSVIGGPGGNPCAQ